MPAKLHKLLGGQALPAASDITVYTVPANRKATVTVNLCNRSTATAIRLALVDGVLGTRYLEYDTPLADNLPLERDRITLGAGQSVLVRAASANVDATVWGVEEDV